MTTAQLLYPEPITLSWKNSSPLWCSALWKSDITACWPSTVPCTSPYWLVLFLLLRSSPVLRLQHVYPCRPEAGHRVSSLLWRLVDSCIIIQLHVIMRKTWRKFRWNFTFSIPFVLRNISPWWPCFFLNLTCYIIIIRCARFLLYIYPCPLHARNKGSIWCRISSETYTSGHSTIAPNGGGAWLSRNVGKPRLHALGMEELPSCMEGSIHSRRLWSLYGYAWGRCITRHLDMAFIFWGCWIKQWPKRLKPVTTVHWGFGGMSTTSSVHS